MKALTALEKILTDLIAEADSTMGCCTPDKALTAIKNIVPEKRYIDSLDNLAGRHNTDGFNEAIDQTHKNFNKELK